jgi:quercetin dioxygenase-like cupin family protein
MRFARITEARASRTVGGLNGQLIKVLRADGDRCPWHSHEDADEICPVLAGTFELHFRDHRLLHDPGEFHLVPEGAKHRAVTVGPVKLVVIQPPPPPAMAQRPA